MMKKKKKWNVEMKRQLEKWLSTSASHHRRNKRGSFFVCSMTWEKQRKMEIKFKTMLETKTKKVMRVIQENIR